MTLRAVPAQGQEPLNVIFNGTATDDGQVASYSLDFGDRTTPYISATPPTDLRHIYLVSGTYVAKLEATDNEGLIGSAQLTIRVTARPPDTGGAVITID